MKLNNRGMTLIEMIVAFAILGIVSVSIFGMMLTGTKTYTRLTNKTKLEYESQLAMANIERRLMNCQDEIAWDGAALLLVDNEQIDDATVETKIEVIYYKNEEDNLYYTSATNPSGTSFSKEMYLLGEHVTGMSVSLIPETDAGGNIICYSQAKIVLEMTRNDQVYKANKIVTLRNKPVPSNYQFVGISNPG